MQPAQNSAHGYGDFGRLAQAYGSARRGFPEEVIELLFSEVGTPNSAILDLGCGTGISTRQLTRQGTWVVGADKDAQMVEVAQTQDPSGHYVVSPADHLPFPDETFNAVTAFSAFHWFAYESAIREIERVVKRGGVILVVNKHEADDFKSAYRNVLRRFVDQELPDIKKEYDPSHVLGKCGLTEIRTIQVPATELFTVSDAVSYLKTISLWNLVPNKHIATASESLESFCASRANSAGMVERKTLVCAAAFRRHRIQ